MSEVPFCLERELRIASVIPAYNASSFIHETLSAVRWQRRPPDEIIVVDDGSADDTVEVVKKWADTNDSFVRIITQTNQGPSAARNAAIFALHVRPDRTDRC